MRPYYERGGVTMIATEEQAQQTRALAELRPNPLNPRGAVNEAGLAELADSIRAQGILQPLLVTPDGIIVAGHRRYRAAQAAGLERVPVLVRPLSEPEQLAVMLTENVQREDLTVLEEARAYRRLEQLGMGRAEIARTVGVPPARITERSLLLELDPLVQEIFARNDLPVTAIRPLARIPDPERQRHVASLTAKRLLTVAQLKGLVDDPAVIAKPEPTRPVRPTPASPSRQAAMERIGHCARGAMVLVEDIAQAMDKVCGICADCGMSDVAVICQACPLPRFILRVFR